MTFPNKNWIIFVKRRWNLYPTREPNQPPKYFGFRSFCSAEANSSSILLTLKCFCLKWFVAWTACMFWSHNTTNCFYSTKSFESRLSFAHLPLNSSLHLSERMRLKVLQIDLLLFLKWCHTQTFARVTSPHASLAFSSHLLQNSTLFSWDRIYFPAVVYRVSAKCRTKFTGAFFFQTNFICI